VSRRLKCWREKEAGVLQGAGGWSVGGSKRLECWLKCWREQEAGVLEGTGGWDVEEEQEDGVFREQEAEDTIAMKVAVGWRGWREGGQLAQ
jgi:hypothetical protein